MQWLIDLVIAAIGIPPVYISRGDYQTRDYGVGDLAADGNFHELDLSHIVPAGATAVKIHAKMQVNNVGALLRFRPGGYTGGIFRCTLRTQVANITVGAFITVGISTDRKIEYQYFGGAPGVASLTVQGWWL